MSAIVEQAKHCDIFSIENTLRFVDVADSSFTY